MADSASIIREQFSVIKDPTDLATTSPYGGTELGVVSMILFKPQSKNYPVTAEEWGKQVVEVVDGGTSVMVACTLRGVDANGYAALFLDTATGSPSGDMKVQIRADNGRAGTLRSTKGMKLLFVPRKSPIRVRAILLRDALPIIAEDASIPLSPAEEWSMGVVFYGRPDSSNRVAEIAYIGDMTL